MSKIDDLIKKYCPNGVELKNLEDVCDIAKGVQFNKKDMNETGSYPVINGGINPSGFIEQYNSEADTITISQGGASAGYVNFLTSKFWAGAHCYTIKPYAMVLNRFLYHFIKAKEYKLQECQYGAGIPALAKSAIASLQIPVPPLEVQREIVQVLDSFTMLTAELSAELSARKKQYEFYRDQLLSFKKVSPPLTLEWKTLKEVTSVFRGDYITQKNSKPGKVPVILGGQEPAYFIDKSNHEGEIVVIARSGASAGFVSYWNEPIYVTDAFGYEAKENAITPKFLYYALKKNENDLNAMKRGAGVPHVSGEMLGEVKIPVPTIDVQKKIVKVLDNFDAICSDLKIGLPAEIELRKKQYEYYRDMLLSFEPLGTVLAKQASKQ